MALHKGGGLGVQVVGSNPGAGGRKAGGLEAWKVGKPVDRRAPVSRQSIWVVQEPGQHRHQLADSAL